MTEDIKKVFVSYSWDDSEHRQWVMDLVRNLRRNGVDATFDQFETQSGTVHLQEMMINSMKENDKVIIVLTQDYAERAESMQGGVGFETRLSLHELQDNPHKFIFLLRGGNFEESIPYHLKGYYVITFTDVEMYEEKFKELLHRIENVPLYEVNPIGPKPNLSPQKAIMEASKGGSDNRFTGSDFQLNREVTDLDKEKFLANSYTEMKDLFTELFAHIRSQNSGFDYNLENFGDKKHIFKLYDRGSYQTGIKMWLGGGFMKGINLYYGVHLDPSSDNAYNETLQCEEIDGVLYLKMTMNTFGDIEKGNPKALVEEIWQNHLYHYFK
ncbi:MULTISPECIES: toll/interleukin-1 receptor domain-containing protein [Pontibacillus]|uniref:Toll/interleukin-1 receptor domain-containing protein n=1 Tax=Pontibacillus chungwhensis TaxID=265426 RepID=A0ABY8V1L5_9BACI|nr:MULTISPECIES: toll/interleukin-1 receptor domain-containing protein [Pontibacillus]MCD5325382.1 toll/interleukin-1 receptor domain-containing protein [Pontibacillus sp. HN14]WIF98499.1 toll/interleukin-1 receptor domain-containing protein [Pontibacillus chungwhensis]